jgi:hypothetical protein
MQHRYRLEFRFSIKQVIAVLLTGSRSSPMTLQESLAFPSVPVRSVAMTRLADCFPLAPPSSIVFSGDANPGSSGFDPK